MTTPVEILSNASSWLEAQDARMLAEGQHLQPGEKLGAPPCTQDGVLDMAFAVGTPNA
jgi:1,4-alpha-glucan branching enzyme